MGRVKGATNKKPYPEAGKKKISKYQKVVHKLMQAVVDAEDDDETNPQLVNESDDEAEEFYHQEDQQEEDDVVDLNEEPLEQPKLERQTNKPQTSIYDEQINGLRSTISDYEKRFNQYEDEAKEWRMYLAEQRALKKKREEQAEIDRLANERAQEQIQRERKGRYTKEATSLAHLLV